MIGIGEERGGGYRPEHPLGGSPEFWEFMCTAAEVQVDPEVGMVEITKLVLASDIGKALNPLQVEAQDEGAAVMGLGHSLMEHLILDEHGRILNLGALDYRIPTTQDVPLELQSILIENQDGPGPYGAKGAGEGGILAIAAAVGAAINRSGGNRDSGAAADAGADLASDKGEPRQVRHVRSSKSERRRPCRARAQLLLTSDF